MAMVKGFVRDRLSLFFSVLFPLFFIIIFGTVFASDEVARAEGDRGRRGAVHRRSCRRRRGRRSTRPSSSCRAPTLDAALDAGAAGRRRRRDRAAGQHPGPALLRGRPGLGRPPCRASSRRFVDQANIALSGAPPTYTLQTAAGRGRVAAADPVHRAGDDRLRHRRRRGVRRGADADHLAGEEAAAPAAAGAGRRPRRVVGSRVTVSLGGRARPAGAVRRRSPCCRSSGCS